MNYVDGFVLVLPQKRVSEYLAMARKASKIWKEHGALEYREAIADDLNVPYGLPFPKLTKLKDGETVVFAWIVYKSKAHRNSVNKKVMKDKRVHEMCDPKDMPFDVKRMSYGGFKIAVVA
ncbi:MAG: DUF1428 domain-containing protein [Candidatus Omnitrophica bacterium]|nr:DUF1428 domain-containing protein [Candidatus Omnitrophota bacterium]